jgi:hypothetical protein
MNSRSDQGCLEFGAVIFKAGSCEDKISIIDGCGAFESLGGEQNGLDEHGMWIETAISVYQRMFETEPIAAK